MMMKSQSFIINRLHPPFVLSNIGHHQSFSKPFCSVQPIPSSSNYFQLSFVFQCFEGTFSKCSGNGLSSVYLGGSKSRLGSICIWVRFSQSLTMQVISILYPWIAFSTVVILTGFVPLGRLYKLWLTIPTVESSARGLLMINVWSFFIMPLNHQNSKQNLGNFHKWRFCK